MQINQALKQSPEDVDERNGALIFLESPENMKIKKEPWVELMMELEDKSEGS